MAETAASYTQGLNAELELLASGLQVENYSVQKYARARCLETSAYCGLDGNPGSP